MTKTLVQLRYTFKNPKPKSTNQQTEKNSSPPGLQSFPREIVIRERFYSIKMSVEHFHIIGDTAIDNSILKREYIMIYHQHGAQTNNTDQNNDIFYTETKNCQQIGNVYLQYDLTLKKVVDFFAFDFSDEIRLVNNDFAYTFEEASLATTGHQN